VVSPESVVSPDGEQGVASVLQRAFDLLNASFAASKMLSNATKGASREHAAREVLRSLIPPVARVESGDVIDTRGHRTGSGQVDDESTHVATMPHRVRTSNRNGDGVDVRLAAGGGEGSYPRRTGSTVCGR
jgi:hypothetical protein